MSPGSASGLLVRILKVLVPLAILVGIGIQFVPVKGVGTNPPERYKMEAPPEVEAILRRSCYDCHSNETRWPWYAKLAPSSWLLIRDVEKGRAHMNFSEWGDTDKEEQAVDKSNSWDQIADGEMPPWFYLPMHPDAKLNDADKAVLKAWLVQPKEAKPAEAKPGEEKKPEAGAGEKKPETAPAKTP